MRRINRVGTRACEGESDRLRLVMLVDHVHNVMHPRVGVLDLVTAFLEQLVECLAQLLVPARELKKLGKHRPTIVNVMRLQRPTGKLLFTILQDAFLDVDEPTFFKTVDVHKL